MTLQSSVIERAVKERSLALTVYSGLRDSIDKAGIIPETEYRHSSQKASSTAGVVLTVAFVPGRMFGPYHSRSQNGIGQSCLVWIPPIVYPHIVSSLLRLPLLGPHAIHRRRSGRPRPF